jgi:hypothetical protein
MSLVTLLEEHGEEIEYDLSAYHGQALSDLWTGDLSWRRLGVLIKHLPPESATKTSIRNATPVEQLQAVVDDSETKYGAWSQTDMLLAQLIDLVTWLQWAKTKAADTRPNEPPKPYPRPGVQRAAAPVVRPDAHVIDLLEYVRTHGGAPPEGYITA